MRRGPVRLATLAITLVAMTSGPITAQSREVPAASNPASPEMTRCRSGDQLGPAAYEAIAQPWIDALWSFYGTGDDSDLSTVTTEHGIEALRSVDWRFRVVEGGQVRFTEEPGIIDFNDWQEWCSGERELLRLDVEPVVDVAPRARTIDTRLGRHVEESEGRQRRALNLTFTRADADDDWVVDNVQAMDFRPRFVASRPAKPCPGLGNPGRAPDPFLMTPWCDAGGDGRKIPPWRGKAGGELALFSVACWPGTHAILIGLPPGTPLGFDNVGDYVRDPRGTSPYGRGFRRTFRPPKDAISSGITNGYATIWTSESLGEEYLIVQVGDRFERWPASVTGCPAN